jgi:DNA-directed RNA polymerase subunit L
MKIEIMEETNNKIKFKMMNSRHTVPEMLKKQLLTHKEVTMASGMLNHPEDKDSEFILVVKNADPKEILIKAIDELQKQISSFKDEMLKVIPKDSKYVASAKPKAHKEVKESKEEVEGNVPVVKKAKKAKE